MVDLAEKAREIQNSIMIKREEIGEERGLKIGREEGRAIGRQEGRQEGESLGKLKTVREFKKVGVSIEQIMKATGLSQEQIEQLEQGDGKERL